VIEMIRKVESERKASAAGDGTGKVARLVRLAGLGEVFWGVSGISCKGHDDEN
jgi:hypothetical protein